MPTASPVQSVLAFLQSKGLTPAQAAGVAGNLQVESGFNPAAYNPREGAIGIAQWEGGRRQALDDYAAATGGSETDLGTQLNFLWSELSGPESGALAQLQQTNDPGAAAAAFDQYYERSSGAARSTRIADAQAIAGGGSGFFGTLGRLFGLGAGGVLGAPDAGAIAGGAAGDAGDAVTSAWAKDAYKIALYVLAGGSAAALFVVGAVHTVSSE